MRSLLSRYGLCLAGLVAATLVRLAFDPLLGNQYAFGMYYPVVMLAGLYGGLGPGLLAMVLGAVAGDYFFVPPRGSVWFFGGQGGGIFLFYFFMSTLFLVLAGSLRVSRRRAEEAQSRLRELNETLEQRVIERTAVARRRADQLRVLAAELTLAEQHERRRLARVLHDHLQQMLVAARMMLPRLRHRPDEETRLEIIGKIDDLLEQCLAESRSLTVELSPPILSEGGLKAAIPWLAHRMEEMHGLVVKARVDPEAEPRDESIRVLLFQAARELLLNVVKHAQAGTGLGPQLGALRRPAGTADEPRAQPGPAPPPALTGLAPRRVVLAQAVGQFAVGAAFQGLGDADRFQVVEAPGDHPGGGGEFAQEAFDIADQVLLVGQEVVDPAGAQVEAAAQRGQEAPGLLGQTVEAGEELADGLMDAGRVAAAGGEQGVQGGEVVDDVGQGGGLQLARRFEPLAEHGQGRLGRLALARQLVEEARLVEVLDRAHLAAIGGREQVAPLDQLGEMQVQGLGAGHRPRSGG